MNSIRSFWTPEKSDAPEFLSAIRQDKIATATVLIAATFTALGLIVCGIGIALTILNN